MLFRSEEVMSTLVFFLDGRRAIAHDVLGTIICYASRVLVCMYQIPLCSFCHMISFLVIIAIGLIVGESCSGLIHSCSPFQLSCMADIFQMVMYCNYFLLFLSLSLCISLLMLGVHQLHICLMSFLSLKLIVIQE